MGKPGGSVLEVPRRGWSRPVELGMLVVAAGLSVILAGAWFALSRRFAAVERAVAASRAESGRQNELSRRFDSLSGRVEASDTRLRSQRASAARLERALSGLSSELDSVKRSLEAAPSAAQVSGLLAAVSASSDEVAQIKRLAEAAAQEPRVASPPAPDGATAKDVVALAGRVSALDAGLKELGRKVSSLKTPQVRVNEESLRAAVNQAVQEEIKKAFEERRNAWRGRREQQ